MDDHIYRVIELVGSSQTSIDDAIKAAIDRAHATIRNLRWFQVTLKVGFTMEGPG